MSALALAPVRHPRAQIVRYLNQVRESFDIENAKIRRREEKLIARSAPTLTPPPPPRPGLGAVMSALPLRRFKEHQRETRRLHEAEADARHRCLERFEEEMDHQFQEDDRREPVVQNRIKKELVAIKKQIKEIVDKREKEDAVIMASLTDSLAALQRSIINNFGSEADRYLGLIE